ncbi:MAG TPA: hypothetical protein VMF66_11890 [Candidatus Acidoferrum sp.]|nr:hypothetical protein [Candidatus Acidoferrum sp.]
MNIEPSCIELLVPRDERLLAAIDTALLHACERAGLSARECSDLSSAVSEVCEETFTLATGNGKYDAALRVLICDFEARVEVTLERSDGGQVAPAGDLNAVPGELKIDRVSRNTNAGRSRTVLIKEHHATAHPQSHR